MLALVIPKVQVTHVSYRDMSIFGEPYGNYGAHSHFDKRKHGPAVAVIGAIGSVSAGAATMAAATSTFGTIMGGLMMAGGVMSGLGALTGNKTLSTIGMGLGLATGIGSAFTQVAADGAVSFANPFSESYKFSSSVMGKGFSKVGDFVKDLGGGDTAASNLTSDIVSDAAGYSPANYGDSSPLTGTISRLNDAGQVEIIDGVYATPIDSELTKNEWGGYDALNTSQRLGQKATGLINDGVDAATNFVTGNTGVSSPLVPEKNSGLLATFNQLGNNKLLSAALGGASDAYQNNQMIEETRPQRNANTALTRANTEMAKLQTERLRKQMENMNQQKINLNAGLNFGQQQQINSSLGQSSQIPAGKMAAIIDNQVVYVSPEEFRAIQNERFQQAGLLNTQGVA
jgi:hypothetical protein